MLLSIAAFALAAGLIVLLPGPDTLVVVRSLLRRGPGEARRTVLGVLTGLSVWVVCSALGISALLRASRDGYTALRIAGAVYLVVLGVQAWRSRGATGELDAAPAGPPRRSLVGTGYSAGLATDLLNPKVGVFFVTFLPAFIPHHAPVGWMSLGLGGLFVAETALYFVVLLAFADKVLGAIRRPRARKLLDRMTGTVLVGFGVRLAVES